MSQVIKILSNSAVCNSTPSTFGNNKLVQVTNINTSAYLVTQRDAANNIIGSIVIQGGGTYAIEKAATDTLESNTTTNVVATVVAYRN